MLLSYLLLALHKNHTKMKKIFTLAAALLVMGSASFAQDAAAKKTTKKTETKKTETKSDSKMGDKKTKSTKKTETKTETKSK